MDTAPMDASNEQWNIELRRARERLGISRAELSKRSGVPVATLRRWEDGSRNPRPGRLQPVLEALNVPNADANTILQGPGLAPAPALFPPGRFPGYFYTVDELRDVVEEVAWPEFALNENAELVAANSAVQALWRIDFAEERARRSQVQLNLLTVASDRQFADRVANWDEVVSTIVATFKGRPREPDSIDEPNAYFEAVLGEFAEGDPAFLSRLLDIWDATPAREAKARWSYNVVWVDPEYGEMRFVSLVNTASEPDALGFNDWIPVDAETWQVLEKVKGRGR